ncbi:MAG: alpha/beta hydrolase [Gammaproteobacteria bacterium]|nr:alpha/beta hydrolase [Gammaproteobacteria bacterium]MCP5423961.1 alpha/beta hydrolase [Gammaproteobacteria bacterium]MCP5459440.1 alpha/beta hydrolase [Gammaproteobacteria bacterium]
MNLSKVGKVFFLSVVLILFALSANAAIVFKTHPLERNGIPLFLGQYHEESLPADASHILLVHGLTYSSHEFDVDYQNYSLVRWLAEHGYHVWIMDIAGYGRSGDPTDGFTPDSDYAAQDIAAAVNTIRAAAGVEKIDLLGWSWGTVTTARMAALYPQWINKLILYAPIYKGLGAQPVLSPWHKNNWVHAADDFQKRANGDIDYSIADRAVVATYLSNCWRYDGERSPNGGRRDLLQSKEVSLFDVTQLPMPVLMVGGTHDPYLNWDALDHAFQELPQKESSQMITIDGASHVLMFEKDYFDYFHWKVLDFLGR